MPVNALFIKFSAQNKPGEKHGRTGAVKNRGRSFFTLLLAIASGTAPALSDAFIF
jgi:hypothetical protein